MVVPKIASVVEALILDKINTTMGLKVINLELEMI